MCNKVEEILNSAKSHELLNSNIAKLNELIGKKEEVKDKKKNGVLCVLAIVGVIVVVAVAAYALYRYFTPDYLEDFEDDFEDEFDDDFFEDEDEDAEDSPEDVR